MQINTDISTETTLASRLSQNTASGASAPQTSSTSADSQIDSSLQRLTDGPAAAQDGEWEIQDENAASQALNFLRQSMSSQPGMAMTAQANQLPQNVLSLLQSTK